MAAREEIATDLGAEALDEKIGRAYLCTTNASGERVSAYCRTIDSWAFRRSSAGSACGDHRREGSSVIIRIWHGWTSSANADAYEHLLRHEIFTGIAARGIAGYRGIQLLRRPAGDEVEFVTLMWFDTLAAVQRFAGEEYDRAVVPAAARALLARFDERAAHYEVRHDGPDR